MVTGGEAGRLRRAPWLVFRRLEEWVSAGSPHWAVTARAPAWVPTPDLLEVGVGAELERRPRVPPECPAGWPQCRAQSEQKSDSSVSLRSPSPAPPLPPARPPALTQRFFLLFYPPLD